MPTYGYLVPTRGIVTSSDDDATLAAKAQADVIGLALRAEALGFGSVWVGDSIMAKPRLDPLSTLAAIATATDGVGLGTAVHLPTLRHPVQVAHQTATVDQLSGGRLRYGVGVGIGPDVEAEYDNLDVAYGTRGARLDESLDVMTRLWEGSAVDYSGNFYDLDAASIGFGPVSDPPIYVASAAFDPSDGFPRRIRERLVEYGSGWLPIALDPETYAEALAEVHTLFDRADRSPATLDPGVYLDVVVDDDESAALDEARRFYDQYYTEWGELSDERIRERGAFGPANAVADTLDAYGDAGSETIVVRFTARNQREQLERFRDVL